MAKQSYQNLLKEKRIWYKAVRKSFCPILNEDIIFNSRGFNHLLNDGTGQPRSIKERMYRIGLLPLLIPVIKNASKISTYKKEHSKTLAKDVEYWKLSTKVGKNSAEVSVILRKIGTGNITFYSIWKRR